MADKREADWARKRDKLILTALGLAGLGYGVYYMWNPKSRTTVPVIVPPPSRVPVPPQPQPSYAVPPPQSPPPPPPPPPPRQMKTREQFVRENGLPAELVNMASAQALAGYYNLLESHFVAMVDGDQIYLEPRPTVSRQRRQKRQPARVRPKSKPGAKTSQRVKRRRVSARK